MRFALRTSVGARLTITIFLVIMFSWVLSSGMASYLAYQRMHALRQEMLNHPEMYPYPIPEPRFGIMDFLVGPQPSLVRPGLRGQRNRVGEPLSPPDPQVLNRPPGAAPGPPLGPGMGRRLGPANAPARSAPEVTAVLVTRAGVALLLAVLAGKWLGWHFSRRLTRLAKGAEEFNQGNLDYRISEGGEDEFAKVSDSMNSMAQRVAEQVKSLEDDARRRRQMLADVAHELRSPVATIRMMAGALEDGVANDPERQSRAVSSLVRSSDRLLHLVTDLLELARLDLNELPIHPRLSDIRELAASAVESHAAAAAEAGVGIHPVASGEPVMAMVDPVRLSQVLDNLLNNAISYAGAGSEIRVTLERGADARIVVSDNGRGIAERHLPYVFDSFYRADPARTPNDNHSGLGLRISRALIEAHGGRLTLVSTEGGGTTAAVTLPMEPRA